MPQPSAAASAVSLRAEVLVRRLITQQVGIDNLGLRLVRALGR